MKKLIAAGALITLLASPAFAQPNHNRKHVNTPTNHKIAPADHDAQNKIMWGNTVRGQDPDPFIRGAITRGLGNYGGD